MRPKSAVLLCIGWVLACLTVQAQCPKADSVVGTLTTFGLSIAGMGDLNGDGKGDFAVSDDGYASGAGRIWLFSGATGDTIRTYNGGNFGSINLRRLGYSIANAGDFNGDGKQDIVAGAYNATTNDSGAVTVLSGASGARLLDIQGRRYSSIGEGMGFSVAGAGDYNNDGYGDIIMGAPFYSSGGTRRGRATIYLGQASGGTLSNSFLGTSVSDSLGYEVAGAGKVNNDNYHDVMIWAPRPDSAYVRAGNGGSLIYRLPHQVTTAPFRQMAGIGDLDGDGRDDIALLSGTKIRIFSGQTGSVIDSAVMSQSCYTVVAGGFIDDDSVPDLLCSGYTTAVVYVISGASMSVLYTLSPTSTATTLAVSDVDNDGYSNILVRDGGLKVLVYSCTDSDSDGVFDLGDNCRFTANPSQTNSDADSLGDACDNCPSISNNDQADDDGDGIGNVCDNCPSDSNTNQTDTDSDGVGDACDNCPSDSNTNQADADHDGIGDVCDSCTDTDGDGYGDPGFAANTCATDNCPTMYNPSQMSCCEASIWSYYVPGDMTCDGYCDISDLSWLIDYLVGSGTPLCPLVQAGDVDCSGNVDISDLSLLIDYLYFGGSLPCNVCSCYDNGGGSCP